MKGTLARAEVIGRVGAVKSIGKIAVLSLGVKHVKEKVESTEWHRVKVLREKAAQAVTKNVKVGMLVRAEGDLRCELYRPRGSKKDAVSWQIYASSIDILHWGDMKREAPAETTATKGDAER